MRIRPLILAMLFARAANAEAPDTTSNVTGASVSGIVRDSIAHAPLAGAVVQLVASDNPARFGRTANTDSTGRFVFNDVPDGSYTLGFFHPVLDSLGVEAPLKAVSVAGQKSVETELAIPSPIRLRAAICGKPPKGDSSALIVGVVRDAATGTPASGVTVSGEWVEFSFRRTGIQRRVPRIVATTSENGWFAMCNVPSAGTVALIASKGRIALISSSCRCLLAVFSDASCFLASIILWWRLRATSQRLRSLCRQSVYTLAQAQSVELFTRARVVAR